MTGPVHVLLIEDNAADVDVIRRTLAAGRFEIKLSVAKDGAEGIEFLDRAGSWSEPGSPTLILLDLNLPRKDGRQLLAVIKGDDRFRRLPVVVLSSSDSERDVTNCYNLGANCYIVKPGELRSFRAAVRMLEEFWLGLSVLPRREGHSMATAIGYAL